MHLHGPVDDLAGHAGGHDLDHGDFGLGHLVAGHVHHPGGLECEQAGHVDLAAGFGDALLGDGLLCHGLAKGGAGRGTTAHQFEGSLGQADQTHAVVDASGAKTTLGDLEAAALAQQDVAHGDTHILKRHLDVAVWGIVVAEHIEGAQDLDAGGVCWHHHHALLGVARCFRIGFAHGDEDRAAGIGGAGNPPLAAIDDVLVALALNAGFDVGGVAGGHIGFGHGEGGADLAFEQGFEPAFTDLRRAVTGDGFHVACVGGRAIEHFTGPLHRAHDLGQRCVFLVGEAGTLVA